MGGKVKGCSSGGTGLGTRCAWTLLPSSPLPSELLVYGVALLLRQRVPLTPPSLSSYRGAAEPAQTGRRGRDHLPQERQRAGERCLGLPAHPDCDQPLFQVSVLIGGAPSPEPASAVVSTGKPRSSTCAQTWKSTPGTSTYRGAITMLVSEANPERFLVFSPWGCFLKSFC